MPNNLLVHIIKVRRQVVNKLLENHRLVINKLWSNIKQINQNHRILDLKSPTTSDIKTSRSIIQVVNNQ